jgi:hypothetical protein
VKEAYTINNTVKWHDVWLVPAGIAFVVLLMFILLFRDNKKTAITESEAGVGLAQTQLT